MKILLATDTYYPHVNGASQFTQRLAEGLAKRGHDVSVIAPSRTIRNEKYVRNGVTIFGISSIPIIPSIQFRACVPKLIQFAVERIVEDMRPDVLHIQGHFAVSSAAIAGAKKINIPIIGTNHFMADNIAHYLHLPQEMEDTFKYFASKQCLRTFSYVDVVTTPTKTAADLLHDAGFNREILSISCGIDLERFSPGDKVTAGAHWNLSDAPRFLYVGRLDAEKRIDQIIRAFAKAHSTGDMQLVIAGRGVQSDSLKELAASLGIEKYVRFLGYISDEDLSTVYKTADCFVIASTAELQSIVTMEAMATGLPVIGAQAIALPELVHNGENGFLFSPGDEEALAKAMLTMASDAVLREKMGKESLRIIASHDIIRTFEKYEELYSSVISLQKEKAR